MKRIYLNLILSSVCMTLMLPLSSVTGRVSPLSLVDDNSYIDPLSGRYTIIGEVINISQTTSLHINAIHIEVHNANGAIEKKVLSLTPSFLDTGIILGPNIRLPFKVSFNSEVADQVRFYAITPEYENTDIKKDAALSTICNDISLLESNREKGYSKWKIQVGVTNNSDQTLTDIYLAVSIYDRYSKIVGVIEHTSQDEHSFIGPRQTEELAFDITLPSTVKPITCYAYAESNELTQISESILLLSPVNVSVPQVITESDEATEPKAGNILIIQAKVTNLSESQQEIVHFVQVKDSQGIVTHLSWNSATVAPLDSAVLKGLWLTEASGTFTVETFFWSDIETPKVLSRSYSKAVIID